MSNRTPLFLPFELQHLAFPPTGARFAGVGLHHVPDRIWRDHLDIIQPWRPDYLQLAKAGFRTFAQVLAGTGYDGGLLLLDKHRRRNENRFLQLLATVRPGGPLIVCGSKTAGGASFCKWVAKIVPVAGSLAKNHAAVFWSRRPQLPDMERLEALKNPAGMPAAQFTTAPGMFSYDKIDAGSALLAKHLPGRIDGTVADFGAGWGYLAAQVLTNPCKAKVTALDLYEADFEALEAARRNLAPLQDNLPVHYHWLDLASEPLAQSYDAIISNPPFHQGRAADSAIGQKFIHTAARSLKAQGQFILVANRHLPYEAVLSAHFRQVETLETADGFKVLLARR